MWSPNGYIYRSEFTRHSIKPNVALGMRSTIRRMEVSGSGSDDVEGENDHGRPSTNSPSNLAAAGVKRALELIPVDQI